MAAEKVDDGYDFEFVDKVEEFQCAICHLVLRDPVQIKTCGHRFCKECLSQHKRYNGLWCPNDRTPLDGTMVFEDAGYRRQILSLMVHCPNKGQGCEWKGELSEVWDHKMNICQFEFAVCPNDQCAAPLLRRDLVSHTESECPCRPVKCLVCGEISPLFNRDPKCIDHEKCFERYTRREEECKDLKDELVEKKRLSGHDSKLMLIGVLLAIVLGVVLWKPKYAITREEYDKLKKEWNELKKIKSHGYVTGKEYDELKKERNEKGVSTEVIKYVGEVSSALRKEFQDSLQAIRADLNYGYVILRIDNTDHVLQKGRELKGNYFIDSQSIYSRREGYKLKMRVWPGGTGEGSGSHLSVGVVIMKGDYDYQHGMWPFRQTVRFTLVDQNDISSRRQDVVKELGVCDSGFQKPQDMENGACLISRFYRHYDLQQAYYIQDDAFILKMEVITAPEKS